MGSISSAVVFLRIQGAARWGLEPLEMTGGPRRIELQWQYMSMKSYCEGLNAAQTKPVGTLCWLSIFIMVAVNRSQTYLGTAAQRKHLHA